MFNVGDRVIIRDDLALNKKELPDLIGLIGIVREVFTTVRGDVISNMLEVSLEKSGVRMRLFPKRFKLIAPRVPDWEV